MTRTKLNKLVAVFLVVINTLLNIAMPVNVDAATSTNLSISDNGISFICSREGFHSTCYSDYSQSSIGYGTKCTGSSVQPHASGLHTITKDAAMAALKTQVNSTYAPRVRAQTIGIEMNQNQFDALVSLCYNCGGGNTMISNSPLVKYFKGELTESQARSQYSNYIVTANGQKLQGLVNRRNAEADLFFSNSGGTTISKPIWDTGDVLLYKIHSVSKHDKELENHKWYGKYVLLRVLGSKKFSVGGLPKEFWNDINIVGIYNWVGSSEPSPAIIKHLKIISKIQKNLNIAAVFV